MLSCSVFCHRWRHALRLSAISARPAQNQLAAPSSSFRRSAQRNSKNHTIQEDINCGRKLSILPSDQLIDNYFSKKQALNNVRHNNNNAADYPTTLTLQGIVIVFFFSFEFGSTIIRIAKSPMIKNR